MAETESPTDEATQEIKQTWKDTAKSLSKNYWFLATVILALLLVGTFVTNGITGNVIGTNAAGQAVVKFAESRGINAEVISVSESEKGDLYEVLISIEGQQAPLYVTKDGEYMIQSPIPLTTETTPKPSTNTQTTDVPKTDTPEAELYIWSYCPYGVTALDHLRKLQNFLTMLTLKFNYTMQDTEILKFNKIRYKLASKNLATNNTGIMQKHLQMKFMINVTAMLLAT